MCINGFLCHLWNPLLKRCFKRIQHHSQLSYACKSTCNRCDAFVLLSSTPRLFTVYYISISWCIVALCQVWFAHHGYVKKVNGREIFSYYGKSFGLSSCHCTYFFKGVSPSFNSLICCLHLLGMLGFDHSCIYHLFPTKWSPYYSRCRGICWNQHFSLPTSNVRYSNFTTPSGPFSSPPFEN